MRKKEAQSVECSFESQAGLIEEISKECSLNAKSLGYEHEHTNTSRLKARREQKRNVDPAL